MNNEPVAWIDDCNFFKEKPDDMEGVTPLYTHPVKCNKCNDTEWVCENHSDQEAHKCIHCGGAGKPCECTHPVKELTDEEIANTWDDVRKDATLKSSMKDIQDFARAILRKAQE